MKTVALLTGRGGSTLKDKNILPVCGHPLLYYPAMAAKTSKFISEFYVSSDDEKILEAAFQLGYKKILRPEELSRPDSQHADVLIHALKTMAAEGVFPDLLLVLLANAITIKTAWIEECVQYMIKDPEITAVVPVALDLDHHPFRAKKINKEGYLDAFFDFKNLKVSTNRQDLDPAYFLCHNFWVLRVKGAALLKEGQPPWTFMGGRIKPFIVHEAIDVHDLADISRAEEWVKHNTMYANLK